MTDLHHDLNIPIAESRNIKEAKSAFFANLPAPVSVRGCHGTEDLLSAGPSDLDRQRDSCRTRFSPSRPSLSPSVPVLCCSRRSVGQRGLHDHEEDVVERGFRNHR